MDNINSIGIGSALAAMTPDEGRRYDGTPMLSALPDAPTVRHRPTLAALLRRIGFRVLEIMGAPAGVLRRSRTAAGDRPGLETARVSG